MKHPRDKVTPDLFHQTVTIYARRTDPSTSHVAMAKLSKRAPSHIQQILDVMLPGVAYTPRRLSELTGLEYHQVQRMRATMMRRRLIECGPDETDGMQLWRKP